MKFDYPNAVNYKIYVNLGNIPVILAINHFKSFEIEGKFEHSMPEIRRVCPDRSSGM